MDAGQECSANDLVDYIIEKFFSMQRIFDGKLMELQHKVDMSTLGAEDLESLKFDLEIAQQENTMLEERCARLSETITSQESKLAGTE